MMNTKARCGGVMELEIIRANGDVEYVGKIHNILGGIAHASAGRMPYNSSFSATEGVPYFATQTSTGKVSLSGTFSQSGTTLTRQTGAEDLTAVTDGDLFVFSTGERAYKVASIGADSCTVSTSQSVGTTSLTRYKTDTAGFGLSVSIGAAQTSGGTLYGVTTAYANGVLTNTMIYPRAFSRATSAYTCVSISAGIWAGGNQTASGSFYDLPAPLSIAVDDQLIIKSWVYTVTYDQYTPRTFAASPLTGVSGTGTMQRLTWVHEDDTYTTKTKIWLVTDANKMTLPNMISRIETPVKILASSIATKEELNATWSQDFPTYSNNNNTTTSMVATVVTGGVIKQIIWGDSSYMHGVIEYDTPITISPGQVITINTSHRMDIEIP